MPSIVAPETEGLELAVTLKTELTVAPLAGELTVITSFEVLAVFACAAGASQMFRTLRTIQRKIILTEPIEGGTIR